MEIRPWLRCKLGGGGVLGLDWGLGRERACLRPAVRLRRPISLRSPTKAACIHMCSFNTRRRTLLLAGMATSTYWSGESESQSAMTGTFTYEASCTA